MSSGKKNVSSGSGRSKPRLVKRRPLRSHMGKFPVAEADLSTSLPQFAGHDSAGINGAPLPESDRLEKFRNFLFSASKPFSNANLNLEENEGSVFGDTLHSTFKPEAKGFSDEGWKSTIFKSGIPTNVGFVFGANNSGSIKWNELGIKFGDNRSDLVSETATEPKASSTSADGKENKFKEFSNGDCRLRENMETRQECDGARSSGDFGAGRKTQADTEAELLKEKTNNVFVFASSVNTTGSSRRSTSCKLSESMKKLNIDGCESIGLGNNKYPFADSSGSSSPKLFVFRASPGKGSDELDVGSKDGPELSKTSTPPIFSSTKTDFEVPSTGGVENKEKFSFGSIPAGGWGTTFDSGTLEADSSSSFTFNANSSVSKTMEFGKRRSSTRGKKWTKAREKAKQHNTDSKHSGRNPMSKEGSQNDESTGCYSPMDFSPNQDDNCAPLNMKATCSTSAEFDYSKADRVADLSKKDMEDKEKNKEFTEVNCGRCVTSNCNCDWIGTDSDVRSNTSKGEGQSGDRFRFSTSAEDGTDVDVTFSLSTAHGSSPVKNCRNRKKYRMRVGCSPNRTRTGEMDRLASTVGASSHGSSSLHVNHSDNKDAGIFNPEKLSKDKGYERKGAIPTNQESCEKWRIRGNNAYKKGFMSKAEEFYTKGINSIPQCEVSACTEVLVLCYSNRAAALMSGGRIREALQDCKTAATLDPKFVKVQIRAANCHLALGETEEAVQCFRNCLESNSDICLDRRITIEAANGLQRAEKVAECINNCSVIFEEKTSDAAIRALDMISEVLPLCPYSEKLLELKGETLLMLLRFEDVIRFCKQTLVSSEKNFHNNSVDNTSLKLWKWRLMAKSYFHLGKLEASLDLLDKEVQLKAAGPRNANHESSIALQVAIRELLRRKHAGNEAFLSGRYTEAVENYTAALSSSMVSRPFAAVCFCNRAAAHQAAGQIVDAIADCSSAIAFDGSYSKALSRRASLHETIRDYGQAASDLQRLISLLENITQEKLLQSGTPDGSTCSNGKELRQARIRLLSVEKKAKKEIFLNHYLILGIKSSDTASEIKKAYRKAALRHHPDKAGQALPRSESGDDGRIWKEIAEEVQKDADRLFKMIGEAYAVLSDPTKRSKYDLQDELRNSQKESGGGGPSDFHSSSYDNWGTRRYWH